MRFSEKVRQVVRLLSNRNRSSAKDDWSRRDFIAVTSVVAAVATRLGAQPRKEKGKATSSGQRFLRIHPAVGIARVGNSPDSFYLEPRTIGGKPIECDSSGNPIRSNNAFTYVRQFKKDGRIRRQAAQFAVYVHASEADAEGTELSAADIESIEWTVHLANKKEVWYNNDELVGNVMLARDGYPNYYDRNSWHNPEFKDAAKRRKSLIIDPGPRSISRPGTTVPMSRATIPSNYPHGSFPDPADFETPEPQKFAPYSIDTLGDLKMDSEKRLVVLGGHGRAGGLQPIATYTGADTWFDDNSDGPVTCTVKVRGWPEPVRLTAWVIVGSPKFAPELRNISNLDDVMFDVAVRYQNLVPELYSGGKFNNNFTANYERDIQPIFDRIADYIWVANVPSMVAFTAPKFDPRDSSPANRANRMRFFKYFRDSSGNEISAPHNQLLYNGVPLVPLNAGSNPVTNQNVDRFAGLTNTQYFLLGLWANGRFTSGPADPFPVSQRDAASVGNCVGHPMSPGIEVTWTLRNPVLYESPYRIKHAHDEAYYREHGLSVDGDETASWYARQGLTKPDYAVVQDGCEPGDLTKRMSSPWMADFYQCAIQYVSFRDPVLNPPPPHLINQNVANLLPPAPTYYANWWPPQSPSYVITSGMTKEEQAAAGIPAGYSVYYARGANNIPNLVIAWSYMGFILNENTAADSKEARDYPYFVEKERNHEKFLVTTVAVGSPVDQLSASGSYSTPSNFFSPTWYLKEEDAIAECNGIPDCDRKP